MSFYPISRRDFVKFVGHSTIATTALLMLPSCVTSAKSLPLPFVPLDPTDADLFSLADGFQWHIVAEEGQKLTENLIFGSNNDFTQFFSLNGKNDEGLLWVNHEAFTPLFVSGYNLFDKKAKRDKSQVDKEQLMVGGSILHIKKSNNKWSVVENSHLNKRLDAKTPIPFANGVRIKGQSVAIGTLANCAGGRTPWGTVLTCEENFDHYYGDVKYSKFKTQFIKPEEDDDLQWYKYYNFPPEHYGWVVEVDLQTGKAQKHTSMGRFSHEAATVFKLADGRVVVYTGDDHPDKCLYKFVSEKPNDLTTGELFVAHFESQKWISLNIEKQPILQQNYKTQLDVLTYAREASELVGGSKLDRPEDIEIDPMTGNVFITLTGNYKKGNFHGSILKISYDQNDHLSESFKSETFLPGGEETGFSSPDNLAFDNKGNLWVCCDVSTKAIGKAPYSYAKNNSLFYIPMSGLNAGKVFRVASGPVDSELTGICFSADYQTLFVAVQHPGERSKSLTELRSTFPHGTNTPPKSCVVAITGEALQNLTRT